MHGPVFKLQLFFGLFPMFRYYVTSILKLQSDRRSLKWHKNEKDVLDQFIIYQGYTERIQNTLVKLLNSNV